MTKANIAAVSKDYVDLQLVQIFFGTSTYDRIERDVKTSLQSQIGLIGGTLGLFTGFSILSAVEIVYFVTRAFLDRLQERSRELDS